MGHDESYGECTTANIRYIQKEDVPHEPHAEIKDIGFNDNHT